MDTKSLAIARQQFAQCVFNHKIQEVASERQGKNASVLIVIQLLLTAAAITAFAFQAGGVKDAWLSITGIVLTALDFMFVVIQLTYSFDRQAQNHKTAALKYLSLRDRYMELIGDIMSTKGKSRELIAVRKSLSREYQAVGDAPQTLYKDYVITQKRLGTANVDGGEQYTWSDDEINLFLPTDLKLT